MTTTLTTLKQTKYNLLVLKINSKLIINLQYFQNTCQLTKKTEKVVLIHTCMNLF